MYYWYRFVLREIAMGSFCLSHRKIDVSASLLETPYLLEMLLRMESITISSTAAALSRDSVSLTWKKILLLNIFHRKRPLQETRECYNLCGTRLRITGTKPK